MRPIAEALRRYERYAIRSSGRFASKRRSRGMRSLWCEKAKVMPAIGQQIRRANTGRKILRDWKIDGYAPVPLEQAQARANVCLTCPLNEPDENWLWDKAKVFYISRSLNLRRIHKIHLAGEDKLNTCAACGCVLRIKVHSPLCHILKHTPKKEHARYPAHCWVLSETINHTTT